MRRVLSSWPAERSTCRYKSSKTLEFSSSKSSWAETSRRSCAPAGKRSPKCAWSGPKRAWRAAAKRSISYAAFSVKKKKDQMVLPRRGRKLDTSGTFCYTRRPLKLRGREEGRKCALDMESQTAVGSAPPLRGGDRRLVVRRGSSAVRSSVFENRIASPRRRLRTPQCFERSSSDVSKAS